MGLPHAAGDRPHQAEPLDAVELSACQAEWEDRDVVETVPRRILVQVFNSILYNKSIITSATEFVAVAAAAAAVVVGQGR